MDGRWRRAWCPSKKCGTHTHTHAHKRTHTHTHTNARTHTHTRTRTHAHTHSLSPTQVGWVMEEGLVSFQKVRDWGALQCQQHICEVQGTPYLIRPRGNPGAKGCLFYSTPIQMLPESVSICGRLTYDLPLGCRQGDPDRKCATGGRSSASATSARSKVSFPPPKRRICTRNRA